MPTPELPINVNKIKWSKDEFEIMDSLEHDDVELTLRGAVTKVGYDDNDDGTFDRIHTFKPKMVDKVVIKGKAVKGTDKRRQSALLKGQIEHLRREFAPTEDEQEFYDKSMQVIRKDTAEVLKANGLI